MVLMKALLSVGSMAPMLADKMAFAKVEQWDLWLVVLMVVCLVAWRVG